MDIEKVFTMTNTQQGILYQCLLEKNIYDEIICLKLNEKLEHKKVQTAWNAVAKENMVLRTIASWEKTRKPVLIILKDKEIEVKGCSSAKTIDEILEEEQKIGINIQKQSVRVVLCSDHHNIQYMILVTHHLFIDGWSTNLLLSYFWKAYNGLDIHHSKDYQDYLVYLKKIKKDIWNSWEGAGCRFEKMFLPYQENNKKDIRVSINKLNKNLCAKVLEIQKEMNVSAATIFYAAWALFLGCYNKVPYFGITYSGRYSEGWNFNEVVGLFMNTTPFAINLSADETLKEFYAQINERVLALGSQQSGSIADVSKDQTKSLQEFNSICVVENYPIDSNKSFEVYRVIEKTHYDCVVQFYNSNGIQVKFISNGSVNIEIVCEIFVEFFSKVIFSVLNTKIKDILLPYRCNVCLMSPFETQPLVNQWENISKIISVNVSLDTVDLRNICLMQENKNDYIYMILGLEYIVEGNNNQTDVLEMLFGKIEELAAQKYNITIVKFEGVYPDTVIDQEGLHTYYNKIDDIFKTYNNVEIIDISKKMISNNEKHYNKALYYDVNVPFDQSVYNILADLVYRNLYYKVNHPYKVIIVDCDNTLWKGTVADIGVENVKITKEYSAFQMFLKRKKQEGFLLALCSKNYNETVYEVFTSVEMPLKWEDFVAARINWNRKSDSLLELSNELNLSTSSFIFIDDSMAECMEIIDRLPEVCTILFPQKDKDISSFFESLWVFDKFKVTSEDANRTQFYIQEKKRKAALTDNISDSLKKLKIRVNLNRLDENNFERISELSYRTNQFNLNGKKIHVQDCELLLNKNNHYVLSARDEFGDYGIIGFIKYEAREDILYISHYFISCRILGKYVEFAILRFLCNKNRGISHIVFEAYNTGKNQYFLKFLGKIVAKDDINREKYLCDVKVFYEENLNILDEIICSEEAYYPSKNKRVDIHELQTINTSLCAEHSQCVSLPKEYLKSIGSTEWGKFIRVIYDNKASTIDETLRNREKMYDSDFNFMSESFEKTLKIWNRVLHVSSDKYFENFYDAGGTSLTAMELVAEISGELKVSLGIADILKNPNLKDLVYLITCKKNQKDMRIQHINKKKFLISPMIESIYAMHELSNNTVMNLPFLFMIEGIFDVEKFEDNLNKIIRENRILRTSYLIENKKVYAHVLDNVYLKVEKVVVDKPVDDGLIRQFIKRFDLASAPLIRCFYIVSANDGRQYLLLDFHHIIMDGQSLNLLIHALNDLYMNCTITSEKEDYFDYTEWFKESRWNDKDSPQTAYWENELRDSNRKLNLLENVSNNTSFNGQVYEFDLPDDLSEKIREASKRNQVSDFVYLLTVYEIFLYKYTGDRSNNIGVPISCRDNTQMLQMMGVLVNTVILKSEVIECESFKTNLETVKNKVLLAMENKLVALQKVLEILKVDSLFDTMFVYNNVQFDTIKIGDCKLVNIPFHSQVSQKPIVLEMIDDRKTFHCNFTYNTEVFSYDTISSLAAYFIQLINSILLNEEVPVNKLQVVNPSEQALINECSVGAEIVYEDVKLIDIFHKIVDDNLDNIALIYGEQTYSYKKINSMANNLAHYMLKCGVKEKDCVIFIPDDSLCAAIGILAVMKCGAVYIPVLKTLPVGRIYEIVEKSNANCVFSNEINISDISHPYSLNENENTTQVDNRCSGNDLSYIIFTSGTTGTSKGVMVQNSAICNSILWRINEFNLGKEDVSILLLGLAFDGFMTSFFTPLLSGVPLILIDDIRDGNNIVKKLCECHVTNFITTPTLYNIILKYIEKVSLQDLKQVVLAGERVSVNLLQKSEEILPDIELINEYGPTENSVVSTCKRRMSSKDLSVGQPISNCKIRVEDVDGNLCPIGIKGEVCLSGNSLAKGYLGDEKETKRVFVNKSNGIWYHTGDIGSWNNKGELCIYGRKDVQCKINGYRVDLSEIENYVMKLESVSFCSVISEPVFRCYYVADYFIPHKDFVKELNVYLPYYLIPNEFLRISTIPINQNGKRDESTFEQYVIAPKKDAELDSHLQAMVKKCYMAVLDIEDLGCDDNFFSLGGNSMTAIQLQEILKKRLHTDITVMDIFTFPSVNMLVENVSLQLQGGSKCKKGNKYRHDVLCRGINKDQYVRLQYTVNRLELIQLTNLLNIEEDIIMCSMLMLFFADLTEDRKLNCFIHLNGKGRQIEYDYQSNKEIKEYLQDMKDNYFQLTCNEDINLYIDNTITISDKYINIQKKKIKEFFLYISKEGNEYKLLFVINSSKIKHEKFNQIIGKLVNVFKLDAEEWK